jgi:hypothetical protein
MITFVAPHPLGPWRKQPGPADLGEPFLPLSFFGLES